MSDLDPLRRRYLELTKTELPARARSRRWVIVNDHCMMRVILDRLFGGCWYDHLDRSTAAYKQLDRDQLLRCIDMAERLLADDGTLLTDWNRASLRWRGKSTD